jgi:pyocin large subunit-like protein
VRSAYTTKKQPVAKGKVRAGAARALPASRYVAKGFAQGQLDKHFAKHAAEWGAGNITKTGYLKRAQNLLGRDVGGDILGAVRKSGDVLRYNMRTNEFAVGAADGTIKTLFRPRAGLHYWKAVTSGL